MVSDIRKRIYTNCAEVQSDGTVTCNMGSVLENLLLFDQYILSSVRLQELPELIRVFGVEGLKDLFETGSLKIHCEALTTGQIGQTNLESRSKKGILPLSNYSFATVKSANEKEYIHDCFKIVDEIVELRGKQKIKFKSMIAENFAKYNMNAGNEILSQLRKDLVNNDFSIKLSIEKVVLKKNGISIDTNTLSAIIKQIDEDDFHVETNLQDVLKISELESHKLVEEALLGLARRNQRIIDMKDFNALTGFKDDEVSIFESKLDFLYNQFDCKKPLRSLRKTLEIFNFPDFSSSIDNAKIDVDKFLKVRESKECKEFREWIWSIDNASENEIKEYMNNFREKIGTVISTPQGKILRWITGTGLGFVPIVGVPISSIFGVLDTFLLEKVFPQNGAKTFLDQKLPSIYHNI